MFPPLKSAPDGAWLYYTQKSLFWQEKTAQRCKKIPQGVSAVEQYTQTDRKRTESVLHSLSSFLDGELYYQVQHPEKIKRLILNLVLQ